MRNLQPHLGSSTASWHAGRLCHVSTKISIGGMDLATIPTIGMVRIQPASCSLDPAPKLKSVTRSWCPGSCESFPPISLGEAFNWEYSGRV